jgi:hypothetical protein
MEPGVHSDGVRELFSTSRTESRQPPRCKAACAISSFSTLIITSIPAQSTCSCPVIAVQTLAAAASVWSILIGPVQHLSSDSAFPRSPREPSFIKSQSNSNNCSPIHPSWYQRRDPCPSTIIPWWNPNILHSVSHSGARRVALSHRVEVSDNSTVEVLVERRRLGHTSLNVKPGQVGISNATSPKNLGKFDYAHLRVPLPKQLTGSGVHKPQKAGLIPESYFLMVHILARCVWSAKIDKRHSDEAVMATLAQQECLKSHFPGLQLRRRRPKPSTTEKSQIPRQARKSRVIFGCIQTLVSEGQHAA